MFDRLKLSDFLFCFNLAPSTHSISKSRSIYKKKIWPLKQGLRQVLCAKNAEILYIDCY